MTKEEQIQALSKVLLKLLSEESETPPQSMPYPPGAPEMKQLQDQRLKSLDETVQDLKDLGVEPSIVRQIMRRVDEVYGAPKTLYISKPLYEDFDGLTGNNQPLT